MRPVRRPIAAGRANSPPGERRDASAVDELCRPGQPVQRCGRGVTGRRQRRGLRPPSPFGGQQRAPSSPTRVRKANRAADGAQRRSAATVRGWWQGRCSRLPGSRWRQRQAGASRPCNPSDGPECQRGRRPARQRSDRDAARTGAIQTDEERPADARERPDLSPRSGRTRTASRLNWPRPAQLPPPSAAPIGIAIDPPTGARLARIRGS